MKDLHKNNPCTRKEIPHGFKLCVDIHSSSAKWNWVSMLTWVCIHSSFEESSAYEVLTRRVMKQNDSAN